MKKKIVGSNPGQIWAEIKGENPDLSIDHVLNGPVHPHVCKQIEDVYWVYFGQNAAKWDGCPLYL